MVDVTAVAAAVDVTAEAADDPAVAADDPAVAAAAAVDHDADRSFGEPTRR